MTTPTITYIVLVHGEEAVLTLDKIIKNKDKEDKIIVLEDPVSEEYTKRLKRLPIRLLTHKLDKDYSAHRNFVLDKVNTSYMVWLDGDEDLSDNLYKGLKTILVNNGLPDAIWCARLNLFDGVKPIDALVYGWTLQDNIVNYPDLQCRIFKAKKGIKFVGKLHERPKLEKHHKIINLPLNQDLHIIHTKSIETQIKDNEYYNNEFSERDNAGITTQELLQ